MSKNYVTCRCQHCNKGIEFDADQIEATGSAGGETIGQAISCPHCGLETILYVPKIPVGIAVESAKQQSKNLRVCADCGHQVSRNADACPQCGASFKKRHGVFFYVFWGVVSLFVTFFILWILLMVFLGIGFFAVPAFIAARHDSQIRNGITNSVEAATSTANDLLKQKTDYINNSLILYDFTSKFYNSILDGKVPGVDFKIKNTGDKALEKIEITVYFRDSNQNVIYDEKFYPVLISEFGTDNEPLKPGYIWQQEQGKFYSAKKVPSEWQEGNADAKITDIKFQD